MMNSRNIRQILAIFDSFVDAFSAQFCGVLDKLLMLKLNVLFFNVEIFVFGVFVELFDLKNVLFRLEDTLFRFRERPKKR